MADILVSWSLEWVLQRTCHARDISLLITRWTLSGGQPGRALPNRRLWIHLGDIGGFRVYAWHWDLGIGRSKITSMTYSC